MKRRILAILLAAIMVLSAVPFSVFAEEATVACPGKGGIHTKDNCDYVKFAVKDPVCDKDGYTVYTCEGCGDQFVADVIPAKDTPHKLVKATKAATCTATGIAENVWQCTVCEVYFKDAEAKVKYEADDKSYETKALNHVKDGKEQWEVLKTDCTTQKCKLCGATKSTETAHKYEVIKFHTPAATCKDSAKADVKCTICGDIQYNVSVASDVPHKLGELVAAKPATCTTAGNVDYYQCKVCNKYFADANATTEIKDNKHIIAKLGHTTVGGFVISKTPATCISTGKQTYQCGREKCGQLIENEVIPACPEYEELYWVKNTKNNQYVLSGTEKFTTIKPGYTVPKDHVLELATKDGKQLYSNVIKHDNSVLTANASCTEYGFTKKVCKICGTEEVVDIVNPLGHKKGTEITAENKAPTCVNPGRKVYNCARTGCTEKVYEHVNPTGHGTEKTLVTANCKEDGVSIKYITIACSCGKYTKLEGTALTNKVTIKVGKEDKTFYLFDPATAEMTTKDADNNVVLNDPATRVDTLKNIYVLVSSATYVAKNADTHAWQVASVNKQTCTENGTKIEFCAVCGAYKTTVLTATGHNFAYNYKDVKPADQKPTNAKNYVATHQPTCTVVGYYEVKCLNNCGATSSVSPEANKFKDANGHSYKTVTVLPQCKDDAATTDWDETKGYTYIICTVCGDNTNNKDERQNITSYVEEKEYSSDIVGQVHNYVAGTTKTDTIKAGSCTEKGFFTFECEDCGRDILVVEGNTGTHVKPETKDASNYVAYKAPTCCTVGNQERYVCARCGKWNISEKDAEIAKTAHAYKLVISAKAAQCTNDNKDANEGKIVAGYINVYTCTAKGCDSNKFYFYGDTGLDDKDGKDIWDYLLLTDPKTGDAIDWTWVFKKDGNDKRTDKLVDDGKGVKAHPDVATTTSHSYKAQDGKAHTCTTDGYSKYDKCTKCGDIKGKTVDKAKHDDVVSKDIPATCTTAGYTINTCPKCDNVEVTGYVEVLGHKLGDEITVTGSCSTTPSYKYKECSRANCPAGGKVLTTGYTYHEHKNADGLVLGVIDAAKFEKDGTVAQLTTICTAGLDKDARTCKACGWEAAADHHIEKITTVDATCTTAGYTVVTCAGCQEALKETEINAPALNHVYPKGHANEGKEAWKLTKTDAATETATGTKYFECQLCKATKTEVIPPVSTIYLDLTYANANGKEGFAEYSLITVNVLLSSKKAAIRTLSYELNYDETKLEFVSAKFDNTFSIASINDDNGAVKFAGMSPNAVEVGEAAVIATITFRALAAGDAEFYFDGAEAYLEAGAKVEANVDLNEKDDTTLKGKISIATLMDVYTKDTVAGTIDMQDALAIYDLMTNSEYNVAADLDKDGEITANDLQLFYSIFVGTMKKEALRNYEVN